MIARAGAGPRLPPGGRRRPNTTLAAQLLGFVNRDGVGQYGVEQYYNSRPGRPPGSSHAQTRRRRRARSRTPPSSSDPGTPGADLRLTIDAGLQLAVEQEILAAWVADRPRACRPSSWTRTPARSSPRRPTRRTTRTTTSRSPPSDPNRFIDPIVSSVYEPGSVFKMLTAVAGLETRRRSRRRRRSRTPGILKLDGGQTHIDDADHKAMGWMTFEDAIAYSRNVVAAKVALGLGKTTKRVVGDPPLDVGAVRASGRRPGSTSPARSAASSATRRSRPVAPDRPRERLVRPGRRGHADPARDGLRGDGERRPLIQPHVVQAVGATPGRSRRPRPGPRRRRCRRRSSGMMNHVVTDGPLLPRPDAHPGLRRRRQDRHRPDLGPERATAAGATGSTTSSTTRSSATSAARPASRTCRRVRIKEGTPTIAKLGQLEMPVMSFELFRRIAPTRSRPAGPACRTRPPAPVDATSPVRPAGERARATLGRVTDRRDPSAVRGRRSADPGLTADDLVAATGGAPPRPIRPADPRRRRRLPRGPSRQPLRGPAGRADRRPSRSSPRPLAAGAAGVLVAAAARTGWRSTTVDATIVAGRRPAAARCSASRRRGAAGSTRSSSASPARSRRPRRRRRSRRSSARRCRRCRTRATRTTRSGCR